MDDVGLTLEDFAGLHVWGGEHLPRDVPLGLQSLRDWADREVLIFDDGQLLGPDRLSEVWKYFKPDDRLLVLVNLSMPESGRLLYDEVPFIPINALIAHRMEISIVHMEIIGSLQSTGELSVAVDYARIGFWLQGSWVEFATEAHGRVVLEKLARFIKVEGHRFESKSAKEASGHDVLEFPAIEGAARARFSRVGRSHELEIWTDAQK